LQALDNTRHTQFQPIDIDGLFLPAWRKYGKIDPFRLFHMAQIVTFKGTFTSRWALVRFQAVPLDVLEVVFLGVMAEGAVGDF